jgi:hypothetical protein
MSEKEILCCRFQDFYEAGERDAMLEEISILRDQVPLHFVSCLRANVVFISGKLYYTFLYQW